MPSPDESDDPSLTTQVDLVVEDGIEIAVEEVAIAAFARAVLERECQSGDWSIAVVLTSDQRLRELHRDYMGIDEKTDVITFPSVAGPGGVEAGGDIVISVDRAAEQARDYGHSTEDEIRFLVAHGLLHLCGWTDESLDLREAMLARQAQLVAEIGSDAASV
jgi:probable rRNA maturation factor